MRVLHVHAGNIYGGVESMMLTLVRQQVRPPGMESFFALCFGGRLAQELTAAGARVYQLGKVRIRQPLSVRRARANLRTLLARESFNAIVVHSSWSLAVFGRGVRATGIPLVQYFHAPPDGRSWLELLARRTVPDMALCNSKLTAAAVSQLYPRLRAETVYCPVAPPELRHSVANRRQTRAECETPDDATVIIQVSRMEPWKGQKSHLEALSLLKDVPDWVCWQVGGGQTSRERKYLQELKEMAGRLGVAKRVRFLGQRSDVAKLMAAADIFCQPNTNPEPFGIVFVEALYARLPVVTTDFGGGVEIVDDSCGALVPAGDTQALAGTLRRLIQDQTLREKLGNTGPARARQLCDPEARLNQMQTAVRRLRRT